MSKTWTKNDLIEKIQSEIGISLSDSSKIFEEIIEDWRIEWTRRTLKKWRIKFVTWRAKWNWTPPRRSDSIRNVRLVMGRKDWWLAKDFKSVPQKSVCKIHWIGELGCTATFSSIIRLKRKLVKIQKKHRKIIFFFSENYKNLVTNVSHLSKYISSKVIGIFRRDLLSKIKFSSKIHFS